MGGISHEECAHALKTGLGMFAVACALSACTVTIDVKDTRAPSFQGSLELDYELARSSGEAGLAPTPVEIRSGGKGLSGVGFRVRGKFENTFTWTAPGGTLETTLSWPDPDNPITSGSALDGKGWQYRGRALIMPGLSVGANQFFLAFVTGLQGEYLELDVKDEDTQARLPAPLTGNSGNFGIPVGVHAEFTLAQWVTPFVTYTHVFNVSSSGTGLIAGIDADVTQVGLRLWPGLAGLWLEAGYIWTQHSLSLAIYNVHATIDGPYGGVGYRF